MHQALNTPSLIKKWLKKSSPAHAIHSFQWTKFIFNDDFLDTAVEIVTSSDW
jgi:hypothetical protein